MHIDTGSGLELTVVAPGVVRGHRSHVSTHIFLPSTCPFPLLVYRQWFCGKIVYGLVRSFVHAYSKFHSSPDCGGVIRDHKETHVARREPRTTKSLVAECTSPFFLNLRYMLLNLSSPFLRAHCMDARTIISLSFFSFFFLLFSRSRSHRPFVLQFGVSGTAIWICSRSL